MKKILASLAVILTVSAVKAACIQWTMGLPNSVVTDKMGNPYSSTIYLIVADDLSGISDPTQSKEDFLSALSAITINSEHSASSEGKSPTILKQLIESDKIVDGISVGALIVSEENGKGYYRLATKDAVVFTSTAPDTDRKATTTSWNTVKNASWVQGYTVPEPATGALALAGLALLFRRKKA